MAAANSALIHRSLTLWAALGVLVVLLVGNSVVGGGRATGVAEAGDLEVTGTLSQEPEGRLVVKDGSTTYGLVSAIDLTAYLGRTPTLSGGIQGDTLVVLGLTLGAIHAEYGDGSVTFTATGVIDRAKDGYMVVMEGIPFSLLGSNQLDQVVGKPADIQGQLTGTMVTLTSVSVGGGYLDVEPLPEEEVAEPPTEPDPGAWPADS